jgi:hypothetical protein
MRSSTVRATRMGNKAKRQRRATIRALAPLAVPPLWRLRPDQSPKEIGNMSFAGLEDAALVLDALAGRDSARSYERNRRRLGIGWTSLGSIKPRHFGRRGRPQHHRHRRHARSRRCRTPSCAGACPGSSRELFLICRSKPWLTIRSEKPTRTSERPSANCEPRTSRSRYRCTGPRMPLLMPPPPKAFRPRPARRIFRDVVRPRSPSR